MQQGTRLVKIKGFIRFHFTFMGYNFIERKSNKKIPKYILWATRRRECEKMIYTEEAIDKYKLVKRRKYK